MEFARAFQGKLTTETMLVTGVNDSSQHIGEVAKFLSPLHPAAAYLAIPTRSPAEKWAQPPDETVINRAYQIFTEKLDHVEYLVGFEGNTFSYRGDVKEDLLNMTAVHPMREDSVEVFLDRAHADWEEVRWLIANAQLIEVEYAGHNFYLRRFKRTHTF